jgi:hypothetical protein
MVRGHQLSVYLYSGVVGAAERSAPTAGLPTPHPSLQPPILRLRVKFRLSSGFLGLVHVKVCSTGLFLIIVPVTNHWVYAL